MDVDALSMLKGGVRCLITGLSRMDMQLMFERIPSYVSKSTVRMDQEEENSQTVIQPAKTTSRLSRNGCGV
jgi:hypothetical protein